MVRQDHYYLFLQKYLLESRTNKINLSHPYHLRKPRKKPILLHRIWISTKGSLWEERSTWGVDLLPPPSAPRLLQLKEVQLLFISSNVLNQCLHIKFMVQNLFSSFRQPTLCWKRTSHLCPVAKFSGSVTSTGLFSPMSLFIEVVFTNVYLRGKSY